MAINNLSRFQTVDFDTLKQQLEHNSSMGSKSEKVLDKAHSKTEFLDLLEKGLGEVNSASKQAEKASMDLATGKSSNIHETMLAVTKAELGFSMMVQLRNKMLEAYQEVMRMQV